MDMVTGSDSVTGVGSKFVAGMGSGSGDGASSGGIGPGMLGVGTGGLTSYNTYTS